ncbi:hypothetical protein N7468_008961 [Penicillium chermesinum]|uniref:B30.2/SPRY domain-containing protein n=1 Tax=Penicillium chermesinum TaxID=63820 RepID=A0A9W9NH22_9EURO|nr:uncharacterized protein N7468_008961 [Penicillium chermesinum]KAJ5219757.1 hypothetical protein N7468_008961 [Penicillium chermesinum]
MATTQPAGSPAPSSNINSPIIPPGNGPLLNGSFSELNARSSPAPASNASVQGDNGRAKRAKKDSRKKREAKGLDAEGAPPRRNEQQPSTLPSLNQVTRRSSNVLGQTWDFYEVVDKLTNKGGYRYTYAIADQEFPHIKYRQTDISPYHARFSFEDSPPAIFFSEDALAVTTSDAWHTARANVCAREGSYYYEARVISGVVNSDSPHAANSGKRGHVRLGFARREADLDVNVGVDCYGYGIRDVNGEVVNRMRCEPFFPEGEAINEGDVIGMLISLPSLTLHKKIVEGTYDPAVDGDGLSVQPQPPVAANIIRDRTPFQGKIGGFYWQQSHIFPTKYLRDYAFNLKETPTFGHPSPFNSEDASLRTLPGSSITIFKNGVQMGTPFRDLYAFLPPASRLSSGTNNQGIGVRENADDGMIGYYPAVSCYGGGAVECRFDGPWWVGPPERTESGEPVRAIGERFNDQIVEDVVADIVDEIEAMFTWGNSDGDVIGNDSTEGLDGANPEALRGGVAALDSVNSAQTPKSTDLGVTAVYDSAANSNQATPAATGDLDVGIHIEDTMSVGTAGTPNPAADQPSAAADEDVEMTQG